MNLNPSTQINLFEHKEIFNQLYKLYKNDNLPNKILFSGEKGIGKSTLAYHLINFVLSENEDHHYDFVNNKINSNNKSYKLILNKSNPNFYLIDVLQDKKNIDLILRAWLPSIVYHAAAYKHVPIVEHNLSEGFKNNVLGTLSIAKASQEIGVENFVFVSTDKG